MNDLFRRIVCGGLLVLMASPALAVKPATWKHRSPQDFSEGTFDHVVATSDGELMLGRAVATLYETKDKAYSVNALARGADGAIYAATSGQSGMIYRVSGGEAKEFAKVPDANVMSLVFSRDGMLLAGTGGERGRIFRIDAAGKCETFAEFKDVKYVWAMVRGREGEIYAATGTEGKLFRIDPSGKESKVLYDAKQKSLLCLAIDDHGMLYAGTDEDGVIYRVDSRDGKAYVLYDSAEPEISSIALDSQGNVFAATASADRAKPGSEVAPKPAGKPETATSTRPSGPSPSTDTAPASMLNAIMAKVTAGRMPTAAGPAASGNVIYRIDRNGFVTEVFREKVMILAMAEAGGKLYAATGNEGRIYEICPAEERSTCIAKLTPSQAVSMLRLEDGCLVVGTANAGAIVRIEAGYAKKGTFVCKPLDAKQIVRYGQMRWRARIPEGTRLTIATRSGNVEDADNPAWDAWSGEMDAAASIQIASPAARFLQYRLTFEATRQAATAVLSELELSRMEDNRPPMIESVSVGPIRKLSEDPALVQLKMKLMPLMTRPGLSQDQFAILWKAEDPNGDEMLYDLFYREYGQQRWIRYKEDIKDTVEVWDDKTVSDGLYEMRVVARDTPDNPPGTALSYARVSDPIVVDNTPPTITVERMGFEDGKLHVHAVVKDRLSVITDAKYTVNSHDKWVSLSASDDVFDALQESLEFVVEKLESGENRIVIRVTDDSGNAAYLTSTVTRE